jgi:hypothetical protein
VFELREDGCGNAGVQVMCRHEGWGLRPAVTSAARLVFPGAASDVHRINAYEMRLCVSVIGPAAPAPFPALRKILLSRLLLVLDLGERLREAGLLEARLCRRLAKPCIEPKLVDLGATPSVDRRIEGATF